MIKNYLDQNKISLYKLSKATAIPYSTLSDLANGKVDVQKCQVGVIKKIADYIGLSLDDTYRLATEGQPTDHLKIKNRYYYLSTPKGDVPICKANNRNAKAAGIFAEWYLEDLKDEEAFDNIVKRYNGRKGV